MTVDLVAALSGPHLDLCLPLFLGTLGSRCGLSDVQVHLVDKGIPEHIRQWVDTQSVVPASVYNLPGPLTRRFGEGTDVQAWSCDTAATCQWMVDNCGSAEWVFISHFDVIFHDDILSHYISHIGGDVGQIGEHSTGLVGYRRHALKSLNSSFNNLDGLRLVKNGCDWKLRYVGDKRCVGDVINITGLDVGEWLELHLQLNGWSVITFPYHEVSRKMSHCRTGSGYHGDITKEATRAWANDGLRRHQLKPI